MGPAACAEGSRRSGSGEGQGTRAVAKAALGRSVSSLPAGAAAARRLEGARAAPGEASPRVGLTRAHGRPPRFGSPVSGPAAPTGPGAARDG